MERKFGAYGLGSFHFLLRSGEIKNDQHVYTIYHKTQKPKPKKPPVFLNPGIRKKIRNSFGLELGIKLIKIGVRKLGRRERENRDVIEED